MLSFPAVFLAGLLASLSPCVYPLIPITVGFFGTQAEGKRTGNILAYAFGQIVAFSLVGLAAVYAGETLGFTSESRGVNLGVGWILLAAGGLSLYGKFPELRVLRRKSSGMPSQAGGAWSAAALGAGSALVASPCTSPILAGVLATMATSATLARGLSFMVVYSLGFSLLFVILGLGLLKLPRSGKWMVYLHKGSALVLCLAGLYYLHRGWN